MFQLRFSYVSAQLKGEGVVWIFLLVPKYPHSSKSNFWLNFFFCVSAVFQLAKTGCSPFTLGVAEVGAPRRLLLEQQQRTQRPGVLLGGSPVDGWWHPSMPQWEDPCVNTVRLDLHGQERGPVRALLSGNVAEEYCGRVSAQQNPIGEG